MKSSLIIVDLEKGNKTKTHLQKLVTDNAADETTDPKQSYSNLCKKQSMKTEVECSEYLTSINISCLTNSDTQSCKGWLTVKECWDALRSMKNNKNPGNDDSTKEFLKYFWGKLGTFLVLTLSYSFEKCELSTAQKQAIITLLEKKDNYEDKRFIKNWIPISLLSLLNVAVKVVSKALATRIKTVFYTT